MPIPSNQITVAEIHINGLVAAGGSNTRSADFVFHYRRTTTSSPVTKAALDTVFQTNVAVPIFAALNAGITQQNNTLRWVNDYQDPPAPFSHALVGGVAGDRMSTILAAYVLMRTALRGRSFKGSKHFFPLSEADTTTGSSDILNAASLALWATAITAMGTPITDSNGNTWNLCILSRKLSKLTQIPVALVVANDVTFLALNKRIGRMRHREVKSVY